MNQNFDLIVVGASTRSAGFSALRAGFRPLCLDQFADADLAAVAPVRRIGQYPHGIVDQLESLPPTPVIYTGGLENHLPVLQAAQQRHELWGNTPEAVSSARDPQQLGELCRLSRVGVPETLSESKSPAANGDWLIRPRHGSGGRGIHVWDDDAAACATLDEPHVFQQRITGMSFSAAFLASGEAGDVRFVGVTQQLIGEAECHARPFQWCGNIGPVVLPIPVEHVIRRLGNILKWKLGLQGLFGIDFVVDADGSPWVTEVNPRYPGSLELLEHFTGTPLLRDHARCFAPDRVPEMSWNRAHPGEFLAKAIYYAPFPIEIGAGLDLPAPARVGPLEFPTLADIPAPQQTIETGHPVCTVFSTGQSALQAREGLGRELARLDRLFGVEATATR